MPPNAAPNPEAAAPQKPKAKAKAAPLPAAAEVEPPAAPEGASARAAEPPPTPFPDLSRKDKNSEAGTYDGISVAAQSLKDTPYDYMVIGSGAGGGPLAARLASYGFKVLVLEAGIDPAAPLRDKKTTTVEQQRKLENERRLYHCPGLNGTSTEPHLYLPPPAAATPPGGTLLPPLDPTSWCFTTHHFANDTMQRTDRKFDERTGGLPYPRGCGLGGSTGHNVLISIVPADSDWQRIADLTNDDSWSPAHMRAIFRRMERSSYGVFTGKLARIWKSLQRKLGWETGERGSRGWLDISFANPAAALRDAWLRMILLLSIIRAQGLGEPKNIWRLLLGLITTGLFRPFDLNDPQRLRSSPQGFTLIPMSVNNARTRRGPREHLLETRIALRDKGGPGCVDIATGVHVRRLLFVHEEGKPPRAVGVEFSHGLHLYRADLLNPQHPHNQGPGAPPLPSREGRCFAKREIFLCGGSFNSPQILMLSGVGDEEYLRNKVPKADDYEIGLTYVDPGTGKILPPDKAKPAFVDLPGVGRNLRDRLELSVISELSRDYTFFKDVRFQPYPKTSDPELNKFLAEDGQPQRDGLYTSNGAAFALVWRSSTAAKEMAIPPDLFIFGVPAAFRGYSYGYSQQFLSRKYGVVDDPPCHRLWTWTLLKAFSQNTGRVTLKSSDPFEPPRIDHHYFGEVPGPTAGSYHMTLPNDDLDALVSGVEYVRRINDSANRIMKGGCAAEAESEPGRQQAPNGSQGLRDWVAKETWGHHASGTCRIGRDRWQANPADLVDKEAVIDSKFKVHGVRGLRIVDASSFPYIPGYFVAVPIFIIAEKAAETVLNELSS
ncbi:MAG TPA: GMC family oxidoreductase [Chthoniobacteraceae bacterium]|jgi:choline dehydrogenase-like flavoprotein|nr:GMC family oxidoreductase [Chthoniobacteraceae bacterium]